MKSIRNTFLIASCFLFTGVFAQRAWVDSVLAAYVPGEKDSLVCTWVRAFVEQESDNTIWPAYNQKMKDISYAASKTVSGSTRLYFLSVYSDGINNDGYLEQRRGNFKKAFDLYKQALEIKLDINDHDGTASSLSNIGYLYYGTADYKNAAKFYQKALKIQETNDDKEGAALTLKNLANVFLDQRDTVKYLELLNKSLDYRRAAGDKRGIANCYNSFAGISILRKDYIKGQEYALSALKIFEELGYRDGMAGSYGFLGAAAGRSGNKQMAIEYYSKALEITREIGENKSASDHAYHLGGIYLSQNKISKSRAYFNTAMKYAKMSGEVEELKHAYQGLYLVDSAEGKKSDAQKNFAEFKKFRDSVNKKVEIVLEDFNPDSISAPAPGKFPVMSKEEADRASTLPYMIISALTFMVFVLIMIFFRYRKP